MIKINYHTLYYKIMNCCNKSLQGTHALMRVEKWKKCKHVLWLLALLALVCCLYQCCKKSQKKLIPILFSAPTDDKINWNEHSMFLALGDNPNTKIDVLHNCKPSTYFIYDKMCNVESKPMNVTYHYKLGELVNVKSVIIKFKTVNVKERFAVLGHNGEKLVYFNSDTLKSKILSLPIKQELTNFAFNVVVSPGECIELEDLRFIVVLYNTNDSQELIDERVVYPYRLDA